MSEAPMADYRKGDLVRIHASPRPVSGGVVDHVTRTQVVLRDGRRFLLKTGRLYGSGPSSTWMEPWDRKVTRESAEGEAA